MGIAVMIAQFVLSLSLLVVLHEMGHFLPAKWFKTRVEKFYLFFDPWFSLFKVKKGDTEYGVGWLPLGGYVKISGMIDESMDREQIRLPPQPWEFRSKPAWQRLIIMLGGVTVNFLLGFLIFGFLLFRWGETYLPAENAIYGIHVDSTAMELGLEEGDQIIAVGEKKLDRLEPSEVVKGIVLEDARSLTVKRDGSRQSVKIDDSAVKLLTDVSFNRQPLFTPRMPFTAARFTPGSPAEASGMQIGDRIIGLDGEPTPYFEDFARAVSGRGREDVQLTALRGSDTLQWVFALTEDAKIGVYNQNPEEYLEFERIKYSLVKAIPAGFKEGYDFLASQFIAFGKMFSGEIKAKDSLGGFGTISNLFPRVWNWEAFWRVTAILSLILAVMNLLPIPALDGGHVMFLLWEVVTGRKPSDKFMEYATIVGFIVIIGLVLYANGLDVLRFMNR